MSLEEAALERRLRAASDLKGVVRTLKTLAAVNLRPLESAARGLEEYYATLRLGLACCAARMGPAWPARAEAGAGRDIVLAFGSDLGMVGAFNETLAGHVRAALPSLGREVELWVVGERLGGTLEELGLAAAAARALPEGLDSANQAVSRLILDLEGAREREGLASLHVVHNRTVPSGGGWEAVTRKLLPLDQEWMASLLASPWPTRNVPESLPDTETLFAGLIREYLFISLFEACVESMASENLSRLAAMERAEKNLEGLLGELGGVRNHLRQESVSQELLDLMTAFEAVHGRS